MEAHTENRDYERYVCVADIAFSYFNHARFYNARILNVGKGGMCLRSKFFLEPGVVIWICLKKIHEIDAREGLHSATLAKVKWCSRLSDEDNFPYGVGVSYFQRFC